MFNMDGKMSKINKHKNKIKIYINVHNIGGPYVQCTNNHSEKFYIYEG